MKIQAALSASAAAPFEIAEVELDEPRSDEVLVELRAVGVCQSDLTMKAVWPEAISPIVLGHEGAGVVVAVGADVMGVRPGDNVVLSYRSCGACRECAAGHQPYCRDFRTLNGIGTRPDGSPTMRRNGSRVYGSYFGQSSFASHALAYGSNVVVVGDDIDLAVAAPLGCGVQTGAGTVLNVLAPPQESSLVVFGAGGVGLSAAMAAFASGVGTIIAVDPVANRRQLAAELGASATLDPGAGDVVDEIRRLTGVGRHSRHRHDGKGSGHQPGDRGAGSARHARAGRHTHPGLRHEPAERHERRQDGARRDRGRRAAPREFIPRLVELHQPGPAPRREADPPIRLQGHRCRVRRCSQERKTVKPVLRT